MNTIDYGQPAPEWFRKAEAYNLFNARHQRWIEDQGIRFQVLTHVPVEREFLEKYHAFGTRLMPYVNFMEHRDPKGEHPEWNLVKDDGSLSRSGWALAHHIPDLHDMCLNSESMHAHALDKVTEIMAMGYDGVFVDNVCPVPECHGGRLGKHAHSWKDKSNNECYYELVGKIYRLVKSYGSERAVMLNSLVNDELWKYCDAQMDENIVFSGDSPERACRWTRVMIRYWKAHHAAAKHGKVPVTLNYFDIPRCTEKMLDGAFFSYAAARLFDLCWSDWWTLVDNGYLHDVARIIYTLRLGQPLEDYVERDFMFYRRFKNGIVFLNADEWSPREIAVPVEQDGAYEDLRAAGAHAPDRLIRTRDRQLTLRLPAGIGTVCIPKV